MVVPHSGYAYLAWMAAPIFKIIDGPSPTQTGVSDAVLGGAASLVSAASKAADLYPHDVDGLLQILHFRNEVAKAAAERQRWIGGRLYNTFSDMG